MAIDVNGLLSDVKSRAAEVLQKGIDQALDIESKQRNKIGAQIASIAKAAAQLPPGAGMSNHMRTLVGGESAEVAEALIFVPPPA